MTITKLEWIQSQILQGESISDYVSRLNTPIAISNPTPQSQIPAPIDLISLWSVVPLAEATQIFITNNIWSLIKEAIKQKDLIGLHNYVRICHESKENGGLGILSDKTVLALTSIMEQTIPDPNYQPIIFQSLAQQAGFDYVYTHEVETVLTSI